MAVSSILDHDNIRNSLIYVLIWKGEIVGRVFSLKKPNQVTWTCAINVFLHDGPLGGSETLGKFKAAGVASGRDAVSPLFDLLSHVGFSEEVKQYVRGGRASSITDFLRELGYEIFQVC